MNQRKNNIISTRLDDKTYEAVKDMAHAYRLSVSDTTRTLVSVGLTALEPSPQAEPAAPKMASTNFVDDAAAIIKRFQDKQLKRS